MRRTQLRGHANILKRLVIHAGGFNLGLVMRRLLGVGTPRGLQGRLATGFATLSALVSAASRRFTEIGAAHRRMAIMGGQFTVRTALFVNSSAIATCATG
jgi:hypothetical protein